MRTAVLIGWDPRNSPLPPHLGSYARALLVSQNRRHLFVNPWRYSWKGKGPFQTTAENCGSLNNIIPLVGIHGADAATAAEPVFVNLLRSPEIDSLPGEPVRQPYLSYRPARLHRLPESIPRNRFLGYKRLQIRALNSWWAEPLTHREAFLQSV